MTIVPPAGKFNKKAKIMPQMTDKVEKNAAAMMVILKLTDSCRAVRGGRISIAETSIMPATFMAKTAATAVSRKRITLIRFVLTPMVLGQFFIESNGKKIIIENNHYGYDG